jgi:hypothetical protein
VRMEIESAQPKTTANPTITIGYTTTHIVI